MFSLVSLENVYQRFKQSHSSSNDIDYEARLLSRFYLHPSQIPKTTPESTTVFYHLPLSPNYYLSQINVKNKEEFIHHLSAPEKNTVPYYKRCLGCVEFVKAKRRTLKKATQRAGRGQVPSFDELLEFLVRSNSICAFTGVKGTWSSLQNDPLFMLSLDHKVSLQAGGTSDISNLQVSLQCMSNVKGNFDSEDFQKWVEGIKQYHSDI